MKALIVYWSGTGNTENMANGIYDGMKAAGIDAVIRRVDEVSVKDTIDYSKIALGCPAMGNEILEEFEFEPFYKQLEPFLKGKSIALFGSFGWGDGEWMRDWIKRIQKTGAFLYNDDGLAINQDSNSAYEDSFMFGRAFARS